MTLPIARLALLMSLLGAMLNPVWAEGRRVALVVGNGSYRSVDRLTNPANDARLIAGALRDAGFTLVGDGPLLDLDKARFDRAIQSFGRELQGADVALFYYSGHGMQVNGVNWLVPTDANPTAPRDLDFQMVDASLVLRQMEGAGTRLNMMLLDACRNNPFATRGVRGSQSGLAEMRAPEGTLISYATQPGNVAADGAGRNSPYTTALVNAIKQPGVDVFQVFNKVGLAVKQVTGGDQQPWFASSPVSGNFFFFNGPVTIQPGPAADPETVYWQSVVRSNDPADYASYLQRYPRGTFADLAQRRLAALSAPGSPRAAGGFDGSWIISIDCDAAQVAQRYHRRIVAEIRDGRLSGQSGTQGRPGFLIVEGQVGPDGRALLQARGLTGDARYSIDGVNPGTPYGYTIEARLSGARGAGLRNGRRSCKLDFAKQ